MATVILTVAGSILGGPIGAMLGAAVGQQVDRRLLAPKGRSGPRLSDLAIQTSTYGASLPRLFGTTRVSGTVIWSTDLIESRQKVKTGKGQPKQTVYSYAASFAVALSARPILGVGRIWADGKLLRGAAGDFKSPTGFRLHLGGEGQGVDPLIASAEGLENTPAYRGIAYAVFDAMQLADFGNRIPSLSFEVFADASPLPLGQMLTELDDGRITADCPTPLRGYALSGGTLRGLLSALDEAIPLQLYTSGTTVHVSEAPMGIESLDDAALGAHPPGSGTERLMHQRKGDLALPSRLDLAYADPDRDYQPGVQQAWRDAGSGDLRQLELAAVMTAAEAQALAARALAEHWTHRESLRLRLPWRCLIFRPGIELALSFMPGRWRIRAVSFEAMIVTLDLARIAPGTPPPVSASGGRAVLEADLEHGPTRLRLLDLPPLSDALETAPAVLVAAHGALPGWKRAALSLSTDGGQTWDDAGFTSAAALSGQTLTALPAGPPDRLDRRNTIDIALTHTADSLASTDMAGLLAGRNLALIGQELVQFMQAEPITGGWRLSVLLRGRRGTEWAIATHSVDEAFTLIEAETLAAVALPPGVTDVGIMAIGVGDPEPEAAVIAMTHARLHPPSPVHLDIATLADGAIRLRWVRRSRIGWGWNAHVDAPLGEESEAYRITVSPALGNARTFDSETPEWVYSAADRAADLAAGALSVNFSVAQRGIWGLSRPVAATVSLT